MPSMISPHDTHSPSSIDSPSKLAAVSVLLRMWDKLNLELGDAVVVTEGHSWSHLAALTATWYGAVPVLLLGGSSTTQPPDVTPFAIDGSPDSARLLADRLRGYPRVAAAEMSGRSESADLLFEGLPPYSRLILAGTARESLTIDYYVNVHRKGLTVVSTVLDTHARGGNDAVEERARRLLARPERAAACQLALASHPLVSR